MTQDELKELVAREALKHVQDPIVGVGSGSTVFKFIDALATIKHKIDGAVAASEASAERLKKHGIRVFDLNSVNELPVYIDGADEITEHLHMIKGGGGALTREKIIAAVARKFVCICDASKLVPVLGKFPLPVEVIPMARSYVGREIVKMGGQPQLRENFTTDNGNLILDCHGLDAARSAADRGRAQPDRRRGDQRHLRAPAGGRAVACRGFGRKNHHRQKKLIGPSSLSAVAGRLRQRREPARHRSAAAADRRSLRRDHWRRFGRDHRLRAFLRLAAGGLRPARRPLRPLSHHCRGRAGLGFRLGRVRAGADARVAGRGEVRVGRDHRRVHPARPRLDRRHRGLRAASAAARALPGRPDGRRGIRQRGGRLARRAFRLARDLHGAQRVVAA